MPVLHRYLELLRNCLAHNDDAASDALDLTDALGASQILSVSPVAAPFTGTAGRLAVALHACG